MMMLILKAYKFRLEPTPEQSQRLRQLCGCARFVWNLGLAETKRILDSGEKLPSAFELNRMITVWKNAGIHLLTGCLYRQSATKAERPAYRMETLF